jgi:hypothetical protein
MEAQMTDDGWITTPEVIELVFNLNALQAGDELRFTTKWERVGDSCAYPCACAGDDHRVAHPFRGVVIRVLGRGFESYWKYELLGAAGAYPIGFRDKTTFHFHRFEAWRRPLTPTHKEKG